MSTACGLIRERFHIPNLGVSIRLQHRKVTRWINDQPACRTDQAQSGRYQK
jgi:hypothetical protein